MSYFIRGLNIGGDIVYYTGAKGSAFIDPAPINAKVYDDLSMARRAALRLNTMLRDASGYHFMVPVGDAS